MLTLAELESLVLPFTGGTAAGMLSPRSTVNAAGRWLQGSRNWTWAIRPPYSLSLTISQDYIALPSDFGSVQAIQGADLNRDLVLVTPARLMELRQNSSTFDGPYYGAVFSPGQTSATDERGALRLYIWPTPAASASDVFTLTYYAKWTEMTAPGAYPDVPDYIADCLEELVTCYARGLKDRTLAQNLTEFKANPLYRDAIDRDGGTQTDMGPIRNGITQRPYLPNPYYGPVTGP